MEDIYVEDFRILRKLGEGGMGEVFLASHPALGEIALKTIQETPNNNIRRFLREAKITASLNHQNIVRVYQIGQAEEYFYMAMEYLDGLTLDKRIRYSVLPENLAWEICQQICCGLQFAWEKKIIHRDIKPDNIFLTDTAKLMDFGISKYYDDRIQLTQTGAIMGTPLYISPEQSDGQLIDCRSDIYSLGVTIYEAITGVVPFHGNGVIDIIYKHRFATPENPQVYVPSLCEASSQIIAKMLQKDPNDRYQKYEHIVEDIELLKQKKDLKHAPRQILKFYKSHYEANTQNFTLESSEESQATAQIFLVSDKRLKNVDVDYTLIKSKEAISQKARNEDIIFIDAEFLGLEVVNWIDYLKQHRSDLHIVFLVNKNEHLEEPFVSKNQIATFMNQKRAWDVFQVKDLYIVDILQMIPDTQQRVLLEFSILQRDIKISMQKGVIKYDNLKISLKDRRLQRTFQSCRVYRTCETQKMTPQSSQRIIKFQNSLQEAMSIEGALAAALVDMSSTKVIGDLGNANFDVRAAALGNIKVVQAKYEVVQHLELQEQIEDILITLDTQYHLIRTFRKNPNILLYLVLDKSKINLTLARRQLKMIEGELQFPTASIEEALY
ncbi:serine/threonine protein kinase [Candidatus Uabimicrobium amorphum]|uniref:Serine/threonine protein kinase n=1 Tax=Uabimicrobium amorphum TaxID=2596890 RepID=A0A5S9ITH4_UABAM|nr:serine/threonine-protein kinase [Candidatus Uabimicrobium amorphum]BBM87326.1 serine/threonine protein kinase [Candidatus Uabimicrobium amorphum]